MVNRFDDERPHGEYVVLLSVEAYSGNKWLPGYNC